MSMSTFELEKLIQSAYELLVHEPDPEKARRLALNVLRHGATPCADEAGLGAGEKP